MKPLPPKNEVLCLKIHEKGPFQHSSFNFNASKISSIKAQKKYAETGIFTTTRSQRHTIQFQCPRNFAELHRTFGPVRRSIS